MVDVLFWVLLAVAAIAVGVLIKIVSHYWKKFKINQITLEQFLVWNIAGLVGIQVLGWLVSQFYPAASSLKLGPAILIVSVSVLIGLPYIALFRAARLNTGIKDVIYILAIIAINLAVLYYVRAYSPAMFDPAYKQVGPFIASLLGM